MYQPHNSQSVTFHLGAKPDLPKPQQKLLRRHLLPQLLLFHPQLPVLRTQKLLLQKPPMLDLKHQHHNTLLNKLLLETTLLMLLPLKLSKLEPRPLAPNQNTFQPHNSQSEIFHHGAKPDLPKPQQKLLKRHLLPQLLLFQPQLPVLRTQKLLLQLLPPILDLKHQHHNTLLNKLLSETIPLMLLLLKLSKLVPKPLELNQNTFQPHNSQLETFHHGIKPDMLKNSEDLVELLFKFKTILYNFSFF
jgi:hypothetical protein